MLLHQKAEDLQQFHVNQTSIQYIYQEVALKGRNGKVDESSLHSCLD